MVMLTTAVWGMWASCVAGFMQLNFTFLIFIAVTLVKGEWCNDFYFKTFLI